MREIAPVNDEQNWIPAGDVVRSVPSSLLESFTQAIVKRCADGSIATRAERLRWLNDIETDVALSREFWEAVERPGSVINWRVGDVSTLKPLGPNGWMAGSRQLDWHATGVKFAAVEAECLLSAFAPRPEALKLGEPGRPTKGRDLYLNELQRRISQSEIEDELSDEARYLQRWLARAHPDCQQPTLQTVRNAIRQLYRRARQPQNPTQNPA
jgi:hypothetical protein